MAKLIKLTLYTKIHTMETTRKRAERTNLYRWMFYYGIKPHTIIKTGLEEFGVAYNISEARISGIRNGSPIMVSDFSMRMLCSIMQKLLITNAEITKQMLTSTTEADINIGLEKLSFSKMSIYMFEYGITNDDIVNKGKELYGSDFKIHQNQISIIRNSGTRSIKTIEVLSVVFSKLLNIKVTPEILISFEEWGED